MSLADLPVCTFYRGFFVLKNYVIVALRSLTREKLYTIINICGLTIGLACFMLIMR